GGPARLPARRDEGGQGGRVREPLHERVELAAQRGEGGVGGQLADGADHRDRAREPVALQRAQVDLAEAAQRERANDLGRVRGHVEQGGYQAPLDRVVALGVWPEALGIGGDLHRDGGQVHRRLLGQQRPVVLRVVAVHVLL